ncbi:BMP family ABC transporter substrate-binding protein [Clostridium sp. 2-1]|uniref:BMP family protein n=1 Tax=Clostridium TaxID=1485 RepID=UPI000CDBA4E2|nr:MULTISPECIES: BMP family protein [Clostridium]MBN7573017.1 BMP family ABC transporter substrate-binding protein [Clostridium beijerinckii]MBN7578182.1 BMP family ABC transporter substrate-binding protein [Clostridium beijerinckii]MBN7582791.1 BMP family ABC transporter substrate-binding protein [Clostridium beijerinckii]MBO0521658.1 BMP family ABC transporter substrate-binding protein [Clostridium beijerinckii]POO92727.1 BMP family ABC transporter substrate-binding protein [Clostridium sp. 
MKKLLSLVLTMCTLVALLAGCGGSKTTETSTKDSKDAKNKTYKVAMISDTSISDGGWGAACYNAMVTAAKEKGFETQYTDGLKTADFAQSIRSYADLGYDLIFAPGNQYSDAVKEVAKDYPDVHFALLNGTVETDNIVSLLPDAEQIGQMAGALAGLMSKTNNIGFIGGMELDTTKTKLESYEAAAKAVNPNIQVASAYAGSFSDTAKGMEIANSMITSKNVDVMFGDASAVDSGARQALANKSNTYDIGQPSDLVKDDKSGIIISSVVTDNAAMIKLCMDDVINGKFGNKTIYGNIENGSLSVGTLSDKVPQDIKSKYLEIVDKIKAGTFIKK